MAMNSRELQTAVLFTVLFLLPAVQTFVTKAALMNIKHKTDNLILLVERNDLNCTQGQTIDCLKNPENTTSNNDGCDLIVTFLNYFNEASSFKINKVSVELKSIRQFMKDFQRTCKATTVDTCRITKTTDGDYEKFCKMLKLLQTFKERLQNYLM